jgi:hypothetical protein
MIEKGLFEWDDKKTQAAVLLAKGELTNQQVADSVEIGVATLYRWKDYQEFQERITEEVAAFRDAAMKQEIGDLTKRLARYNKRWQQIDQLISERATADQNKEVPGGTTGLLARDIKGEVHVWKFDAALVKEERELAKQASIELGQWQEKVEHSGQIEVPGLEDALRRAYGDQPS